MTGSGALAWLLDGWRGSGCTLVLGVPIVPTEAGRPVASLAAGAAGDYDADFAALARTLVAGGQSDAVLRLGWEFNGNWYPWRVTDARGAADFAAYWRAIVTTMRAVPGAAFRFVWDPDSAGSYAHAYSPAQAYPGSAYVDDIGIDLYDTCACSPRTPARAWSSYLERAVGARLGGVVRRLRRCARRHPRVGPRHRQRGSRRRPHLRRERGVVGGGGRRTRHGRATPIFDVPGARHDRRDGLFPKSLAAFRSAHFGTRHAARASPTPPGCAAARRLSPAPHAAPKSAAPRARERVRRRWRVSAPRPGSIERGQETVVLVRGPHRDTQALVEPPPRGAVPDENRRRQGRPRPRWRPPTGRKRTKLAADGHVSTAAPPSAAHAAPFLVEGGHPFLHGAHVVQGQAAGGLGHGVEMVRKGHGGAGLDHVGGGHQVAEPAGGHRPRLRECPHHHQPLAAGSVPAHEVEGARRGELAVGLVDHHETGRPLEDVRHHLGGLGPPRRVVGRAEKVTIGWAVSSTSSTTSRSRRKSGARQPLTTPVAVREAMWRCSA